MIVRYLLVTFEYAVPLTVIPAQSVRIHPDHHINGVSYLGSAREMHFEKQAEVPMQVKSAVNALEIFENPLGLFARRCFSDDARCVLL